MLAVAVARCASAAAIRARSGPEAIRRGLARLGARRLSSRTLVVVQGGEDVVEWATGLTARNERRGGITHVVDVRRCAGQGRSRRSRPC